MIRKTGVAAGLVLVLALSGCNFPLLADKQPDEAGLLATSVALTVQAMNSQPQPSQPAPVQQTSEPGIPTQMPQPTLPSSPQATSPVNPCNDAAFLGETILDDSEFAPGEGFTKSWTFENKGSCTWSKDYKLTFVTGASMSGPEAVTLPIAVAPGTQITIEVPLKAPDSAGSYTGYWQLQTPQGEGFESVSVRIKVVPVQFAVTSVYTNLKDVSPDSCPYTFAVDISIVTNAAGKVTYQTETSEGATSPVKTLNFSAAGTKIVELDWGGLGVDGAETDYWLKVYIDTPNHQPFGPFNFSVTCP